MTDPLAIVLAAGKGTRMRSELPKVLVPVGGRPMVRYVVDALRTAGVQRIVMVVGYQADMVRKELAGESDIEFAEQTEQLGTGHAVMMCRPQLQQHDGPVIVVTGDSPMLQVSSVRALCDEFTASQPSCLLGTAQHPHPQGLGRIVRSPAGEFLGIVEEKDATATQRAITEVNMSTYLFAAGDLLWALDQLTSTNVQSEYYLTDCPGILRSAGKQVQALDVLQPCEALSVNTPEDLAAVAHALESGG